MLEFVGIWVRNIHALVSKEKNGFNLGPCALIGQPISAQQYKIEASSKSLCNLFLNSRELSVIKMTTL